MTPFRYEHASDVADAIARVGRTENAQFIAGGTSQVDLLKEGVQRPAALVDIFRIGLDKITELDGGGLSICANVRNSTASDHPAIRERYTAVAEALHAGASQQIRNMASIAGNLLQRTRCPYLRDPAQPCNKRDPGTGCAAVRGFNRMHAIFGQTDEGPQSPRTCIAVHPSDMAVATAALEAVIVVQGATGERRIAFEDLHRLPGEDPSRDTTLAPDDLILAIELPAFRGRSHYLKVRDRASYAYALVSCATALEMDGERIAKARIALGSVAHKPWRLPVAEAVLEGERPSVELFRQAAAVGLEGVHAYSMNGYKPELARVLLARGLAETVGLEPLQGPAGTAFAASVGGIAGVHEAA